MSECTSKMTYAPHVMRIWKRSSTRVKAPPKDDGTPPDTTIHVGFPRSKNCGAINTVPMSDGLIDQEDAELIGFGSLPTELMCAAMHCFAAGKLTRDPKCGTARRKIAGANTVLVGFLVFCTEEFHRVPSRATSPKFYPQHHIFSAITQPPLPCFALPSSGISPAFVSIPSSDNCGRSLYIGTAAR